MREEKKIFHTQTSRLTAHPLTPFKFQTHLSVSIISFVPSAAPVFSVLLMAPLQLPTKDQSGRGKWEGGGRVFGPAAPSICPSSTVVRRQEKNPTHLHKCWLRQLPRNVASRGEELISPRLARRVCVGSWLVAFVLLLVILMEIGEMLREAGVGTEATPEVPANRPAIAIFSGEALAPSLLQGAASQPQTQHAALVQVPELQELLGHGVEPRVGQHVVVVVVADRLLVQVNGEGPEAVGRHLLAQPQRQAHHEEACGKAAGVHAARLPEVARSAQELRVGKQHGEVRGGVGQGIGRPQRGLGPGLGGERWHVDVAGAIGLHALHKVFPGPQEVLEPARDKDKVNWVGGVRVCVPEAGFLVGPVKEARCRRTSPVLVSVNRVGGNSTVSLQDQRV